MQAAIPTNFDINANANIRSSLSGLSSSQSSSGYMASSAPIKLNVKMGDITVTGNADQNALKNMQQIAKDQVDQLEQRIYNIFTTLPSMARVKVK